MPHSSASDYDPLDEVLSWEEDGKEEANTNHNGSHDRYSSGSEWLDGFIARHNITVLRREPWNGGLCLPLAECPFNPDHRGGSAALFINANGKFGFKCHRNGCADKTIKDFSAAYPPEQIARSIRRVSREKAEPKQAQSLVALAGSAAFIQQRPRLSSFFLWGSTERHGRCGARHFVTG
jgi:hypothetical protein